MSQHTNLSPERWATFSLDQQILMIGNEVNRGKRSLELGDILELRRSYERVLRLVDLTVEVQQRPTLKKDCSFGAVSSRNSIFIRTLIPPNTEPLSGPFCYSRRWLLNRSLRTELITLVAQETPCASPSSPCCASPSWPAATT